MQDHHPLFGIYTTYSIKYVLNSTTIHDTFFLSCLIPSSFTTPVEEFKIYLTVPLIRVGIPL